LEGLLETPQSALCCPSPAESPDNLLVFADLADPFCSLLFASVIFYYG